MIKKWLLRIALLCLVTLAGLAGRAWYNGRDRFPNDRIDLRIKPGAARGISVGFAARRITPLIQDVWIDANGDAKWDEADGDTWQDGNGNGRFDAYWLAGFHNKRPARGIHDDIWARAVVIDDGQSRIAIVSLDLIGFSNDDVIRVRRQIPAEAGITYAMIGSTHVHEAPDMLGIWGPSDYSSGLNPEYSAMVIQQAAEAIAEAAGKRRPAYLIAGEDGRSAAHLVGDTRNPQVFDQTVRCLRAVDSEADTTLGSVVVWGNHPETTWSQNLLITSDFPHYVRTSIEKGIFRGDSLVAKGWGGTTVYISGAIGGLMTTHPDIPVRDTFSGQIFKEPGFEKARAEGEQIALIAMRALQGDADTLGAGSIGLRAQSFLLPLDNHLFRLGVALGIFNRGYTGGFGMMRSEAALLTLGDWSFLAVPGEIYPEIVYGGIENPPGADFQTPPVETPPLYEQIPGKRRFIFGLMNDEIGYIIPKSEWDSRAPWLYGAAEQLYGEINSCGPETGPTVYRALQNVCKE